LLQDSDATINTAFDILSLEALFMVPRYGLWIAERILTDEI